MSKTRKIKGYGGKYSVSESGKVFSGEHELTLIGGRYVNLSDGGEVRRVDVAYLVARAFVGNVAGKEYVWHLDGDVRNNRAENLAWREVRQVLKGERGRRAFSGGVLQYDLEGNLVGMYSTVREASEATGVARALIDRCLRGEAKRAKNWVWRRR
jgi:hypothetical protein